MYELNRYVGGGGWGGRDVCVSIYTEQTAQRKETDVITRNG